MVKSIDKTITHNFGKREDDIQDEELRLRLKLKRRAEERRASSIPMTNVPNEKSSCVGEIDECIRSKRTSTEDSNAYLNLGNDMKKYTGNQEENRNLKGGNEDLQKIRELNEKLATSTKCDGNNTNTNSETKESTHNPNISQNKIGGKVSKRRTRRDRKRRNRKRLESRHKQRQASMTMNSNHPYGINGGSGGYMMDSRTFYQNYSGNGRNKSYYGECRREDRDYNVLGPTHGCRGRYNPNPHQNSSYGGMDMYQWERNHNHSLPKRQGHGRGRYGYPDDRYYHCDRSRTDTYDEYGNYSDRLFPDKFCSGKEKVSVFGRERSGFFSNRFEEDCSKSGTRYVLSGPSYKYDKPNHCNISEKRAGVSSRTEIRSRCLDNHHTSSQSSYSYSRDQSLSSFSDKSSVSCVSKDTLISKSTSGSGSRSISRKIWNKRRRSRSRSFGHYRISMSRSRSRSRKKKMKKTKTRSKSKSSSRFRSRSRSASNSGIKMIKPISTPMLSDVSLSPYHNNKIMNETCDKFPSSTRNLKNIEESVGISIHNKSNNMNDKDSEKTENYDKNRQTHILEKDGGKKEWRSNRRSQSQSPTIFNISEKNEIKMATKSKERDYQDRTESDSRCRYKFSEENFKERKDDNEVSKDSRTVFVSQLVMRADERVIKRFFRKRCGVRINDVILLRDRRTGRHKGCAYVELACIDDVQRAVAVSGETPDFQRFPVLVKASEAEKNYDGSQPVGISEIGGIIPGQSVGSGPTAFLEKRVEAQKVYVGSIDRNVTQSHLYAIFSQFGQLDKVLLQVDTATGQSKGFSFLTFKCPKVANLAIQVMAGQIIAGRPLRTGWANMNTTVPGLEEVTSNEFPNDALQCIQKAHMVLMQLNGTGISLLPGLSLVPGVSALTFPDCTVRGNDISQPLLNANSANIADNDVDNTVMEPTTLIPSILSSISTSVKDIPLDDPKQVGGADNPTNTILIRDVFDKDEETEDEWELDICEDFEQECSKHGKLQFVKVMSKDMGGKIYASFETMEAAMTCAQNLAGRWFNKRQLRVSFVNQDDVPTTKKE